MSRRQHLVTLCIFAALSIAHTWPLALAPGTYSRVDNADYSLNAWALSWVLHALPRDPLHVFDANIFYPAPDTLAFSEHLIPQAVVVAPVRLVGGSAVLTCNAAIVVGFLLSGWAMTWTITRWTGDWLSGLVAGSLLAFNAHTMIRLVHVQVLHNYYLPLALMAGDAALANTRTRDAVAFGALLALQSLTSGYWLVFTSVAAVAALVARAPEWLPKPLASPSQGRFTPRDMRWRGLAAVAIAALTMAIVVTPFLVPYWRVHADQGLTRSWADLERYQARGLEYIASGSRLHMLTPLRYGYDSHRAMDTFFPGVAGGALALCALASGAGFRDRRARMFTAIGIAGFALSWGPRLPGYFWLYHYVPLIQGIRATSRFGFLVLVAVAGLAGFGLSWLRARLPHRAALAAGLLALVSVNAEAWRAPIGYRGYNGVPAVYRVLAALPDGPVAEFPFYRDISFFANAEYMLDSTVHWKPVLNGYSGFAPRSFHDIAEQMRPFPAASAVERLRSLGVAYVVIHRNRLGATRDSLPAAMEQGGDFQLVTADELTRVYRLLPR